MLCWLLTTAPTCCNKTPRLPVLAAHLQIVEQLECIALAAQARKQHLDGR